MIFSRPFTHERSGRPHFLAFSLVGIFFLQLLPYGLVHKRQRVELSIRQTPTAARPDATVLEWRARFPMAVAGYRYRINGGTPVDVGNVTTCTVSGLTSDTTYVFEVQSYDDASPPNYSGWSNAVTQATDPVAPELDGFATANARWFALDDVRTDYTGPLVRVNVSGTPTDLDRAGVLAQKANNYAVERWYAMDGSGDYMVPIGGTTPTLSASTVDGKPCIKGGAMGIPSFTDWNGKTKVSVVVASRSISQTFATLMSGGTGGTKELYGSFGQWYARENGTTGYVRFTDAWCRTTHGMVHRYHYDGTQTGDANRLKLDSNARTNANPDLTGSGSVAATFTAATGLYINGRDDGTGGRADQEYFAVYYFGYDIETEWATLRDAAGSRMFGTTDGQIFANGDSLTESYNLNAINPTMTWPSQVVTNLGTITGRSWWRPSDGVIAEIAAPLKRIVQIGKDYAQAHIDDWAQDVVAVLGGGTNDLANEAAATAKTFTATAASDELAVASHAYQNGICVRVSSTGTLPAGLAAGTDYFWIVKDAGTGYLASSVANAMEGVKVNITDAGTGTHTITPTPNPAGIIAKQDYQASMWWNLGVKRVIIDSMTPRTDLGAANATFETNRQTYLTLYAAHTFPSATEKIDFGTDSAVQDSTDTSWYIDNVHGTLAFYTRKANTVTTKVLNDTTAPSAVTSLSLSAATNGFDYSFTAATDNIGVQKYQYKIDSGSWTDAGTATTGSVTGLTPSVAITVYFRAVDFGGNAGASAIGTVTPAGASAIDPESLTSFKAVLYAEDLSQSDNTAVNLWNDRTSSNNDMTGPPSGGASPKFRTSGGPGAGALAKSIEFNGTTQWFDWADFSAFTEAEMFVVIKLAADPPPSPNVAMFDLGAVHADFIPYDANDFYCDFFSTTRKNNGSTGAWTTRPDLDSQYRILNFKSKSGLWELRVDDAVMFTTATNTVSGQATTLFGASVGGTVFSGQVVGVFLSNAVLSSTNHDGVHLFIKNHFGL